MFFFLEFWVVFWLLVWGNFKLIRVFVGVGLKDKLLILEVMVWGVDMVKVRVVVNKSGKGWLIMVNLGIWGIMVLV